MLVKFVCLVVLCSSSWAADPAPCCTPTAFTAHMLSLTAVLPTGSANPDINDDVIHLTYDYKRMHTLQVGQNLDPATGTRANYTLLNDFRNNKAYTVKGNVCTVAPLTLPLLPPCLLANFTYAGTYRVGNSASNTRVQIWSGLYLGTLWMNAHVTETNCVPVAGNFFGSAPDGSAKLLTSYQFLDVISNITLQDDVFRIPDECKHPGQLVG